jgi:ubiquinone/menaquinone biosynthesis C-methylase UbiE
MSDKTLSVTPEEKVRTFYDKEGWGHDKTGTSLDARLWEDLRPAAEDYVAYCRRRILKFLPASGENLLDAASGPVQYPEYLEFSRNFKKHYCVDISESALNEAKKKLGAKGEYVKASLLNLPFEDSFFDAAVSLHTIYHIDIKDQDRAVRELLRVVKKGAKVIVIYANPDRPGQILKKSIRAVLRWKPKPSPLYYHAYPISWWARFSDIANVSIHPWRMLTAGASKRLIPDTGLGKKMFSSLNSIEDNWPSLSLTLGAYPMIVLEKK